MVTRFVRLSKECVRVSSPVGTGKLPVRKLIRDPKTGLYHTEIVEYTNLQERMNEENKNINLRELLDEVNAGKRARVEGISNASILPSNKYEALKNVEKLVNAWDKNPLLRQVYSSKEALVKDINSGVDVFDRCKKYADGLIQGIDTYKSNSSDKEVKPEVKPEVKSTGVNEMKNVVSSEVK